MKDEAIEEIRAVRRRISEEFGHDTKALIKHYQQLEKQYAGKIISNRPVGLSTAKAPSE